MADPNPRLNPYAPPAVDDAPPPAPRVPPSQITRGARLAGVFLLVNAALMLGEKLLLSNSSGGLSIIFDILIGVSLVSGNGKYRTWAMVRACLGGIVFGGIMIAQGNAALAAIQIAVSASIFNLVVGDPGAVRITLSSVVFGLYAILELIALVFTHR